MTQQYLAGELWLLLAQLPPVVANGASLEAAAHLRRAAETVPVAALAFVVGGTHGHTAKAGLSPQVMPRNVSAAKASRNVGDRGGQVDHEGGCRWSAAVDLRTYPLPPPSSTNLARALSSKQRTVVVLPPKPSTLAPHLDPSPSNRQLLRKRGCGSRYDSDRKSSASAERR